MTLKPNPPCSLCYSVVAPGLWAATRHYKVKHRVPFMRALQLASRAVQ